MNNVTLECSNCREKLVEITSNPNKKMSNGQDFLWKVKAKCCYCSDYSFTKDIVGVYRYMGYAEKDRLHPNEPDYNVPKVDVIKILDEDVITFITRKCENAK